LQIAWHIDGIFRRVRPRRKLLGGSILYVVIELLGVNRVSA